MRILAGFLSILMFLQGSVLASAPEINFWKERQKNLPQPNLLSVNNQKLSDSKKNRPSLTFDLSEGGGKPKNGDLTPLALTPFASIQAVHKSAREDAATVVLVQDIHLYEEAQKNIAGLIDALSRDLQKKNQTLLVGLEGLGVKKADYSIVTSVPSTPALKERAEQFLQKNIINGVEFAALGLRSPIEVTGIEDMDDYWKNVAAIRAAAPLKEKAQEALVTYETILTSLKSKIYRKELRAFEKEWSKFHEGSIDVAAYAIYLDSILLSKTPHLQLLKDAYLLEGSLDFPKAEKERGLLLAELVSKLSEGDRRTLFEAAARSRSKSTLPADFLGYLKSLCRKAGVDLKKYPEMGLYMEYSLKAQGIDYSQLINEMNTHEANVFKSFHPTIKEQSLYELQQDHAYLKKLSRHALTENEWNNRPAINRDEKLEELGGAIPQVSWKVFEDFYRVAISRNEIMARNFSQLKTHNVSVLVAGGFHTDGIRQLLLKQDLNIITVTPKITHADPHAPSSVDILASGKYPFEELFSGSKLFVPLPAAASGAMGPPAAGGIQRKMVFQSDSPPPSRLVKVSDEFVRLLRDVGFAGAASAKDRPIVGVTGDSLVKLRNAMVNSKAFDMSLGSPHESGLGDLMYGMAEKNGFGVAFGTYNAGLLPALPRMMKLYTDGLPGVFITGAPPLRARTWIRRKLARWNPKFITWFHTNTAPNDPDPDFDTAKRAAEAFNIPFIEIGKPTFWKKWQTPAQQMREAIELAKNERRPVVICISADVITWDTAPALTPINRPRHLGWMRKFILRTWSKLILLALSESRRPVIYAGIKLSFSPAMPELLKKFSETTGIPVVNSWSAKGRVEDSETLMGSYMGIVTVDPKVKEYVETSDFVLRVGERRIKFQPESGVGTLKFGKGSFYKFLLGRIIGSPRFGQAQDIEYLLQCLLENVEFIRKKKSDQLTAADSSVLDYTMFEQEWMDEPVSRQRLVEVLDKADSWIRSVWSVAHSYVVDPQTFWFTSQGMRSRVRSNWDFAEIGTAWGQAIGIAKSNPHIKVTGVLGDGGWAAEGNMLLPDAVKEKINITVIILDDGEFRLGTAPQTMEDREQADRLMKTAAPGTSLKRMAEGAGVANAFVARTYRELFTAQMISAGTPGVNVIIVPIPKPGENENSPNLERYIRRMKAFLKYWEMKGPTLRVRLLNQFHLWKSSKQGNDQSATPATTITKWISDAREMDPEQLASYVQNQGPAIENKRYLKLYQAGLWGITLLTSTVGPMILGPRWAWLIPPIFGVVWLIVLTEIFVHAHGKEFVYFFGEEGGPGRERRGEYRVISLDVDDMEGRFEADIKSLLPEGKKIDWRNDLQDLFKIEFPQELTTRKQLAEFLQYRARVEIRKSFWIFGGALAIIPILYLTGCAFQVNRPLVLLIFVLPIVFALLFVLYGLKTEKTDKDLWFWMAYWTIAVFLILPDWELLAVNLLLAHIMYITLNVSTDWHKTLNKIVRPGRPAATIVPSQPDPSHEKSSEVDYVRVADLRVGLDTKTRLMLDLMSLVVNNVNQFGRDNRRRLLGLIQERKGGRRVEVIRRKIQELTEGKKVSSTLAKIMKRYFHMKPFAVAPGKNGDGGGDISRRDALGLFAAIGLGGWLASRNAMAQEEPRTVESLLDAWVKARQNRNYKEKIRLLHDIERDYGSAADLTHADIRRIYLDALEELWTLERPVDSSQAAKTYQRFAEVSGDDIYYWDLGRVKAVAVMLAEGGREREALNFLADQVKRSIELGAYEKKQLKELMANYSASLGEFEQAAAYLRDIDELDQKHVPYIRHWERIAGELAVKGESSVPYERRVGELKAASLTKDFPVKVYINPDFVRKANDKLRQSPLYAAVMNRDKKYFEDYFKDINRVFHYLSNGRFTLKLEEVNFEGVTAAKQETDEDVLFSPEIKNSEGLSFYLNPSEDISHVGGKVIFLSDLMGDKMARIVCVHEILHTLGMVHPTAELLAKKHYFTPEDLENYGGGSFFGQVATRLLRPLKLGLPDYMAERLGWNHKPFVEIHFDQDEFSSDYPDPSDDFSLVNGAGLFGLGAVFGFGQSKSNEPVYGPPRPPRYYFGWKKFVKAAERWSASQVLEQRIGIVPGTYPLIETVFHAGWDASRLYVPVALTFWLSVHEASFWMIALLVLIHFVNLTFYKVPKFTDDMPMLPGVATLAIASTHVFEVSLAAVSDHTFVWLVLLTSVWHGVQDTQKIFTNSAELYGYSWRGPFSFLRSLNPLTRLTREKIMARANAEDFDPEDFMWYLSREKWLRDTWRSRTFYTHLVVSIGRHTVMGLKQLEWYFPGRLPGGVNRGLLRLIHALHDIGKPDATKAGNRHWQHKFTLPKLITLMRKWGFTKDEENLAVALMSDDIVGEYMRGRADVGETLNIIRKGAELSGLSAAEFLDLRLLIYQVDAGSYTSDAGIEKYVFDGMSYNDANNPFNKLFIYDRTHHKVSFTPEYQKKVGALTSVLRHPYPRITDEKPIATQQIPYRPRTLSTVVRIITVFAAVLFGSNLFAGESAKQFIQWMPSIDFIWLLPLLLIGAMIASASKDEDPIKPWMLQVIPIRALLNVSTLPAEARKFRETQVVKALIEELSNHPERIIDVMEFLEKEEPTSKALVVSVENSEVDIYRIELKSIFIAALENPAIVRLQRKLDAPQTKGILDLVNVEFNRRRFNLSTATAMTRSLLGGKFTTSAESIKTAKSFLTSSPFQIQSAVGLATVKHYSYGLLVQSDFDERIIASLRQPYTLAPYQDIVALEPTRTLIIRWELIGQLIDRGFDFQGIIPFDKEEFGRFIVDNRIQMSEILYALWNDRHQGFRDNLQKEIFIREIMREGSSGNRLFRHGIETLWDQWGFLYGKPIAGVGSENDPTESDPEKTPADHLKYHPLWPSISESKKDKPTLAQQIPSKFNRPQQWARRAMAVGTVWLSLWAGDAQANHHSAAPAPQTVSVAQSVFPVQPQLIFPHPDGKLDLGNASVEWVQEQNGWTKDQHNLPPEGTGLVFDGNIVEFIQHAMAVRMKPGAYVMMNLVPSTKVEALLREHIAFLMENNAESDEIARATLVLGDLTSKRMTLITAERHVFSLMADGSWDVSASYEYFLAELRARGIGNVQRLIYLSDWRRLSVADRLAGLVETILRKHTYERDPIDRRVRLVSYTAKFA